MAERESDQVQKAAKKRKFEADARAVGKSKYEGVVWVRREKKWRVQYGTHRGDFFCSETDAARSYDVFAKRLGLPLNFPDSGQTQATSSNHSKYVGVHWSTGNQKWKAQIRIDGKVTHLGYFESEEVAAMKYDSMALKLGKAVNFAGHSDQATLQSATKRGSSRFRGLTWLKKRNKWQCEIRVDGKQKYLGTFVDEEEAARKYDEAARPLGKSLNFPLPDVSPPCASV